MPHAHARAVVRLIESDPVLSRLKRIRRIYYVCFCWQAPAG
jgi:hypothetical protein